MNSRFGVKTVRRLRLATTTAFLVLAAGFYGAANAQGLPVTPDSRQDLTLTIYNQNLGLVHDVRRIDLASGENLLELIDVAPSANAQSLLLRAPGLSVLEQRLDANLLTLDRLMEAAEGGPVKVRSLNPTTGAEILEEGVLISLAQGWPLVQLASGVRAVDSGSLVFDRVPEGLHQSPVLFARVMAAEAGQRDLALSYLSGGLSWEASYVAEINPEETQISLTGFVTVSNNSGLDFPGAHLRLLAGTINVGYQPGLPQPMMARAEMSGALMADEAFTGGAVGDQHLYVLGEVADLNDNETKQIRLLGSEQVAIEKEYNFEGLILPYAGAEDTGPVKPAVVVIFENNEDNDLDEALPAGVVRVYQELADQAPPVFLGEDHIMHTAAGEELRLNLGQAFDITGRGIRTHYERFSNRSYETGQEITISNAKDQEVQVRVIGHMPGGWRMISESQAHVEESANNLVWTLTIPAGGEVKMSYRLRVDQPQ